MEEILYNYEYISHDLPKNNLVNMNNPQMDTKLKKKERKQTAIDVCRKNDHAVLRMTAGRSRWQ